MGDATTKVGAAIQPPAGGQPVGIAPNILGALNQIAQSRYFPRQGMERMAAIQRGMAAPFITASAPNVLRQLYQRYQGQPNQLRQIPPNAFKAMGMLLPIPEALAGEEPVQRPPVAARAGKAPSILEAAGLSPEEMRRMHQQAWEEEAKGQFLDLGAEDPAEGLRRDMDAIRAEAGWPLNSEGIRVNESTNPFYSVLDQHIHDLSLHGGVDDEVSLGEGGGWYGLFQNGQRLADTLKDTLNKAEYNKLADSAGVIIHQDSQGFVRVHYFPGEGGPRSLGRAWGEISAQVAGPPPTAGPTEIPEGAVTLEDLFGRESPPLTPGEREELPPFLRGKLEGSAGPGEWGPYLRNWLDPTRLSPGQLEEFVRRMMRQQQRLPGPPEPDGGFGAHDGDGDGRGIP